VTPDGDDQFKQVVREAKELIRMLESTSIRRVRLEVGPYKIEVERTAEGAFAAGGRPDEGGPAPGVGNRHSVLAPLVGTFYNAPSPGAKPFVEVGARVQPGQAIGIIEVMKVMNEVASDVAGVVVEILAQNGHPVQYEQPLMIIDTSVA
jgi:acetyl-CoA carboxylase biotin carboxyl carrier protein